MAKVALAAALAHQYLEEWPAVTVICVLVGKGHVVVLLEEDLVVVHPGHDEVLESEAREQALAILKEGVPELADPVLGQAEGISLLSLCDRVGEQLPALAQHGYIHAQLRVGHGPVQELHEVLAAHSPVQHALALLVGLRGRVQRAEGKLHLEHHVHSASGGRADGLPVTLRRSACEDTTARESKRASERDWQGARQASHVRGSGQSSSSARAQQAQLGGELELWQHVCVERQRVALRPGPTQNSLRAARPPRPDPLPACYFYVGDGGATRRTPRTPYAGLRHAWHLPGAEVGDTQNAVVHERVRQGRAVHGHHDRRAGGDVLVVGVNEERPPRGLEVLQEVSEDGPRPHDHTALREAHHPPVVPQVDKQLAREPLLVVLVDGAAAKHLHIAHIVRAAERQHVLLRCGRHEEREPAAEVAVGDSQGADECVEAPALRRKGEVKQARHDTRGRVRAARLAHRLEGPEDAVRAQRLALLHAHVPNAPHHLLHVHKAPRKLTGHQKGHVREQVEKALVHEVLVADDHAGAHDAQARRVVVPRVAVERLALALGVNVGRGRERLVHHHHPRREEDEARERELIHDARHIASHVQVLGAVRGAELHGEADEMCARAQALNEARDRRVVEEVAHLAGHGDGFQTTALKGVDETASDGGAATEDEHQRARAR
mmetsp:Transcript_17469/g.42974  ORF Transcript_17469/g.42974 Transcript_17469/m.42974 type:complete len:665 (+) Transcript_17469:385-2379(+)